MIQVHREHRFRINLAGRPDHRFKHPLIGVFSGSLRNLDDKRRFRIYASFKKPKDLLEIVDVVSTHCVL